MFRKSFGALTCIVAIALISQTAFAADLSGEEAIKHVGETATVCGTVFAVYRPDVNGKPTFLNYDRPHPNETFTALIWGENRGKFGPPPPEQMYDGKRICVTGAIELYTNKRGRSWPQIIVTDPSQIR